MGNKYERLKWTVRNKVMHIVRTEENESGLALLFLSSPQRLPLMQKETISDELLRLVM